MIEVRIVARRTLRDFAEANPQAAPSLVHWEQVARKADWQSPAQVVAAFSKAKTVSGTRVRFEVAGGDFRLVVAFNFRVQVAFIKFIGTHAEYDKIDAATVSLF